MTEKRKLVMATNNAGKLREARAIAGDRLEILSLADIGFHNDIPETADTLTGNALIKARAIHDATGYDCFADDTGLLVDALDGAPGVYSARYAGEECDPDKNMDLLLRNMEDKEDRRARFQTCIALSLDGEEHIFEGECEGSIARERSGSHGFGYDPVFISAETGKCFAEMTDEDKNAISHRGRAISAMMRWLATLCLCLLAIIPAKAAGESDWMLYNTFDDGVEHVFDTPDKTYFLVQAQYQSPSLSTCKDKLCFLFCLEKDADEVRPYNRQNFLSQSLIRTAYYNAQKRYLLIVYDDNTIDMLYDDGTVHSIAALRQFATQGTKEVRGISFDPELDRVYLATDFGFIIIDDEKYEVASSGVYNTPVDRMVRAGDRLIMLRDGKLYSDDVKGNHSMLSDFEPNDWAGGDNVTDLVSISPSKCLMARSVNGKDEHYILNFTEGEGMTKRNSIGSFAGAKIVENRDGLLLTRTSQIVQIDRETGERSFYPRRGDDYAVPCGSWDLKDVYFAKPRVGFYSLSRAEDNTYTVTRDTARPDTPAAFRSNSMMYTPQHGMLVNSHGIDFNFNENNELTPILLSALRDGQWTMHGVPYFDSSQRFRLINPTGMAQDPDNPDIFYFGSVLNGLMRYNINDYSSLLHMTRTTDSADLPGHVGVITPYPGWANSCMLLNPKFDSRGNLVVAHINASVKEKHTAELWIWSPEDRKASETPETFRPFHRIKISGQPNKMATAIPLNSAPSRNMILYIITGTYDKPMTIYDHNGTVADENDDRKVEITKYTDGIENLSIHYVYCAIEDPATGLIWVGTDNGVFTMDPSEQFTNAGSVSRIKVSRNDGTSLADYLLDGTSINDISIDGLGRKWFSLMGGGIVCTSADGKDILMELNTENSLLPSDNVYATCYNPYNRSMTIATANGICEYYLSAQTSDGEVTARAYPNPVRHDYYGYVTIDGLEDDCLVKITDSAGNLVRELGPASGGRVQWDVCGIDLDRVASGVYFVLASSGPGGGSYGEVTKILVINR